MFRLTIALYLYVSFLTCVYADDIYSIRYESTGFFNYDRSTGEVVFVERLFTRKSVDSPGSGRNTIYKINLHDKSIIGSVDFRDASGACLGYMPKRSPDGKFLASLALSGKSVLLLNMVTNECKEVVIPFYHSSFSWSENGGRLIFKDSSDNSFQGLDPKTQQFERYSTKKGESAYTVAWSPSLNTTLYVFKPDNLSDVDPYTYTSEDFYYFYINTKGEWVKLEDEHPLKNPNGDVFFREHSGIEQFPTTEFFDYKTERMLSSQENFFLAGHNRYAVWLDDGWVYFQGGNGVFNYRNGKFIPFGTEKNPVIPFSVAEGRYAIMYHEKEDRLKVYDMKIKKYIESYEPFWRGERSKKP